MDSEVRNQQPSTMGAYGKVPWAGDFLTLGDTSGLGSVFAWLEEGIGLGANRGEPFKRDFDRGAQKGFVLPLEGDRRYAVGVMAASRDRVGRRFPFLAFTKSDLLALGGGYHIVPLYAGAFLRSAGEAIFRFMNSPSTRPEPFLSELVPLDPNAFSSHFEGYLGWVQSASLRAVGQAIFGASWRDSLAHALYIVIESIRPFRGRENPPTPLAVRLPIGVGFAGAACFWLDVVRTAAGWEKTIPSCFWSFDPSGASITIHFGTLAQSALVDLWTPRPDSDSLSDLTLDPGTSGGALAAIRPDLTALIQGEGATATDLLRALAH